MGRRRIRSGDAHGEETTWKGGYMERKLHGKETTRGEDYTGEGYMGRGLFREGITRGGEAYGETIHNEVREMTT